MESPRATPELATEAGRSQLPGQQEAMDGPAAASTRVTRSHRGAGPGVSTARSLSKAWGGEGCRPGARLPHRLLRGSRGRRPGRAWPPTGRRKGAARTPFPYLFQPPPLLLLLLNPLLPLGQQLPFVLLLLPQLLLLK